jgi:hypothetical protein
LRAEIAAAATRWDQQAAHHRQSLRDWVEWHELIRERFCLIGIEPALAVMLRRGEEAAAEWR